jgi:hypothetical protein
LMIGVELVEDKVSEQNKIHLLMSICNFFVFF